MRHLWFDNRHLLGNAAGHRLRAELETLGSRPREAILAIGDRFATHSLGLAQMFCRQAPAAWRIFGPQRFLRWVAIGERLAGEEPRSREGAAAYFALTPNTLKQMGLDIADAWAAIGRDTLKVSHRVGTQFLQTTAPLLASLPKPPIPRLRTFADEGIALLQGKGWKGEFLAVSYFEAAAVALPTLTISELAAWARLGTAVQESAPWTFYSRLPSAFSTLNEQQRLLLLAACQVAAALSSAAAAEVFFRLPPIVAGMSAIVRAFLLALLTPVIRTDPATVPPLLVLIPSLIKSVDLEGQPLLREKLLAVANTFPAGISALVRSLPRAYEEAGAQGIVGWLDTGATIASDNPHAGVAFFQLESRTSLRTLRQLSAGIDLEEVQELLRKYIQMLCGTSVGIHREDIFSYPPPLEQYPQGGDTLPLPGRIDVCSNYEDNFTLFRTVAAQQAGRREFGTYDFSLPMLWPRLPVSVRRLMENDTEAAGDLFDYFHCFSYPEVIESLFLFIESKRINTNIKTVYPGLYKDLTWVDTLALLPGRSETLERLLPVLSPSLPHNATVYDSALAAALTYAGLLSTHASQLQNHERSSFDSIILDTMTGDALIDPNMDDDSLPPPDVPQLPQLQLQEGRDDKEGGTPLSAEELKALLDAGVDLQIRQGRPDTISPQGLYVTDLNGKLPGHGDQQTLLPENRQINQERRPREREEAATFFYDEWDYLIADYRSRWCRLREIVLSGDAGAFFSKTLSNYAALAPAVKHEFQRIRPEQYRQVRGLEDGEEVDLNAAVTAASDRRARIAPSAKLYTTRRQTERDVAALFLLDVSASTDEPVEPIAPLYDEDTDDWASLWKKRPVPPSTKPRRIIDVTKESLVLMAEALEEIGDAYAIYGFSGQGKDNVEFYHVKSFAEALSPAVKGRIGAIEPKRSTRMGAALRHSLEKLRNLACRVKLLVLLSDGFPQDMDYGNDRRSITYGIRDTMMALREAERAGVLTFCLTVDKAGHDYLREMCEASRYLVLDDVTSLPTELPKIYQRHIRPRGI